MFYKLFLLVTLAGLASADDCAPVVTVTQGDLQGTWQESYRGRAYASFQGVPYAEPPVGDYRFEAPQELTSWEGTWNASEPLSACLQYDPFTTSVTGSEDCLYLNIHTPNMSPDALLPVMVFIHGGAFLYGEGSLYDPVYIMDYDMVVVTLNYRLGPLGFLSTADNVIPGNYGLKDQAFALKWIKNNIVNFGGNPDSITLTGCSAGAASVHYHYLSPLSKDTFHRGLAISGSAFNPWSYATKPAEKATTLASIVGCSTDTSIEIRKCLKNATGEAILNAQTEMFAWKVNLFGPFVPTAESSDVEDAFLTKYPYQASVDGDMLSLPLITSNAKNEGLYPASALIPNSLLDELESQWEELASNFFEYNDTLSSSQRSDVATKIKEYYFSGAAISEATFSQLVQALSDRLFVVGVSKLAQVYANQTGQPTYYYRFSYRANTSLSNLLANNTVDYGVCHCDDILHVYNYPYLDAVTSDDFNMNYELIEMMYKYALEGVPTTPGSDIEWLTVTAGDSAINYLDIYSPTESEMKSISDLGHKTFWDNLGFNENENYSA